MPRSFSHADARRFYDRLGAKQDAQGWYEDRAVARLAEHARFGEAEAIFELGCGTGRIAAEILRGRAPAGCRYVGVDLSGTMVDLARERLRAFGDRARVVHTDGTLRFDEPTGSFDRLLSTYVLDLLEEPDIRAALTEAHRLLRPGGLLCLVGLGPGCSLVSRATCRLWGAVRRLAPGLVGGCRPLEIPHHLTPDRWEIHHHSTISAWGIASEIVVATRT
jgi:SAM-dependent methyltransferase